ncbi:ZIP family metal transporter [Patescibacteria group bacterium]|nr:ZIP family metal transporter [Patescibacteria group bacterium]MBU1673916.1 ZIP family metal transporter [Patescibacteria group bacterium]MBU1963910.1 ZIP family metal transporter [Patescibacteria group bacterium]
MSPLLAALIATGIISLISLLGIVFLAINKKTLKKITILLVGFSAGALMGGALLHLIPEAAEEGDWDVIGLAVIIGFSLFFIIERLLQWHHCHENEGECDVHTFAYTNLIGDGVHNFLDGLIIAAAFVVDFQLGVATSIAVIFHELPQEISDFGVLIHAGLSRGKALLYNFGTALLAVVGAIIGFYFANQTNEFIDFILPFAAGGFIYIAASDLIPELHKEKKLSKSLLSFFMFVLGVAFMWVVKIFFGG